MKYNPKKHHRRSIRLTEYDYFRSGAYFLTLCTYRNQCILGNIIDEQMRTNDIGQQVRICWEAILGYWPNVVLDEFIIMPNHVHGIIIIKDTEFPEQTANTTVGTNQDLPELTTQSKQPNTTSVGANYHSPRTDHSPQESRHHPKETTKTVGSTIRRFNIGVTKWICDESLCQYRPFWQRNYYEHIIRNESELFLFIIPFPFKT